MSTFPASSTFLRSGQVACMSGEAVACVMNCNVKRTYRETYVPNELLTIQLKYFIYHGIAPKPMKNDSNMYLIITETYKKNH